MSHMQSNRESPHMTAGSACEAQLIPTTGMPLEETDIARLMHVGNYSPWNNPSNRYADVGNDTLYHLCATHPLPDGIPSGETLAAAESIFASKMWLIGRAYAVSPERYAYRGKEEGKPREEGREGYESFFIDISRILFEGAPVYRGIALDTITGKKRAYVESSELNNVNREFGELLDVLMELKNARYSFSPHTHENDWDVLRQTQEAVAKFALVLRKARFIRDRILDGMNEDHVTFTEDGQFFPRSFSSKFLHFHFPKLVFIYDGTAEGNLYESRKVKRSGHITRFFSDQSSFSIPINTVTPVKHTSGRTDSNVSDARYTTYSVKAFSLARAIYNAFAYDKTLVRALEVGKWEESCNDPLPRYYSITRMADALISNSLP